MTTNTIENTSASRKGGLRWSHVLWIVFATILLTAGATYWTVRTYVFAKDFKPVVLKQKELVVLNKKLEQLGFTPETPKPDVQGNQSTQKNEFDSDGKLVPEAYSEIGSKREVTLTERELNALLAKNTDLARNPVLGGKTLRVTGGLEVAYENSKPIVVLRGVSIMGIPIPNAWLGGMKNIDLVKEFSTSEGFWKAFSDGVENIHVEDGHLIVKLKE
jgi:hypothetical protein